MVVAPGATVEVAALAVVAVTGAAEVEGVAAAVAVEPAAQAAVDKATKRRDANMTTDNISSHFLRLTNRICLSLAGLRQGRRMD